MLIQKIFVKYCNCPIVDYIKIVTKANKKLILSQLCLK